MWKITRSLWNFHIHYLVFISNYGVFDTFVLPYFDDPLVKKEGQGMCSDQIIEYMHSYIKQTLTRSHYLLSIVDSKEAIKRQHNGILRLNAFSVRRK